MGISGDLMPGIFALRTTYSTYSQSRSLAFRGTSRNNVAVNPTGTLPPFAGKFRDPHKFLMVDAGVEEMGFQRMAVDGKMIYESSKRIAGNFVKIIKEI